MKYVALDMGSVLVRVDFRKFTFAISEYVNLSTWEIARRINHSQRLRDVGLLNMTNILESEFDIKSSVILDKLMDVWNKEVLIFETEVFDYFIQLSSQNDLNIAILSNVGLEHSKLIDTYIDIRYASDYTTQVFKNAVRYYSCNVGVRKPQSLYYQSFLQRYPMFTGCVYLDDLSENLVASTEFGFQAVQFDLDKINSKKECKTMLDHIGNMILTPVEEKNSR